MTVIINGTVHRFTAHGYRRFVQRALPRLGKSEGEITRAQMLRLAHEGVKGLYFVWATDDDGTLALVTVKRNKPRLEIYLDLKGMRR